MTALLSVEGLVKHFPVYAGLRRREIARVHAVDGVDLFLASAETVGLVGESGCGKTTLVRTILKLLEPTAGRIVLDGMDITRLAPRRMRPVRRDLQVVFQDPYASLDPRMSVREIVAEPLRIAGEYGKSGSGRVEALLERVGLARTDADRFPHEFSGGQRQRIGLARALALGPRVLLLDEPVSALDVSIRAQIVNLLEDLQRERGIAYLFVAHDLSIVRHVSHRIAVMYLGRIVETGPKEAVYAAPAHPYTTALLSAVPIEDPRDRGRRKRIVLEGEAPSPLQPPSGCRFRSRCWKAQELCALEEPALAAVGESHAVACHFPEAPGVRAAAG